MCKAIFIYVSVYLSGFEHSMFTWPIASQDSVYNWVLLQNISDGTSYLYSDLSETVRSMIRHENITVTAVMDAQRCSFEPRGKHHQVRIQSSTFRLFLVLCNGFP